MGTKLKKVTMKDQLTIEHLAPYLPYGLKLQYHGREIGELTRLSDIKEYDDIKLSIDWQDSEHIWMFKPILRPLVDLAKEITHNGETFIPVDILFPKNEYDTDFDRRVAIECLNLQSAIHFSCTYFSVVQKLISWHFDVFGLIDKGLAVDINTLTSETK